MSHIACPSRLSNISKQCLPCTKPTNDAYQYLVCLSPVPSLSQPSYTSTLMPGKSLSLKGLHSTTGIPYLVTQEVLSCILCPLMVNVAGSTAHQQPLRVLPLGRQWRWHWCWPLVRALCR